MKMKFAYGILALAVSGSSYGESVFKDIGVLDDNAGMVRRCVELVKADGECEGSMCVLKRGGIEARLAFSDDKCEITFDSTLFGSYTDTGCDGMPDGELVMTDIDSNGYNGVLRSFVSEPWIKLN